MTDPRIRRAGTLLSTAQRHGSAPLDELPDDSVARRVPREPGEPEPGERGGRRLLGAVALGAVLVVAVVLRSYTPSRLWLDEAISVSIAKLPLGQLGNALRHDGAPPLYYLLLHVWVQLVGTGDTAVRLLSGVFSVLCLPATWLLGRQLRGPALARAATVVIATSPFAVFFATEARMYSLVMLLALLGGLAVVNCLRRPTVRSAVLVALASGALLLTHYWSFFLLAVTGAWLLVRARAPQRRRGALVALAGAACGLLLFAPWLPVFLFQLRHTGAPWASPIGVTASVGVFAQWSADAQSVSFANATNPNLAFARLLELAVVALLALAVFGRPIDDQRRIELDLAGRPLGRVLLWLCFGGVTLGTLETAVTHNGYSPRYTAPMFVFLPLLAGLGVLALPRRLRVAALVIVAGLGLISASSVLTNTHKTQAGAVARTIRAAARPGDVVVYCPDQLGPAVTRLLPGGLTQLPFPTGGDPSRVDWVDYAARNARASVPAFAARVQQAAAHSTIYLVTADGYLTFGTDCTQLLGTLSATRPASHLLVANLTDYEHADVYALPPRR